MRDGAWKFVFLFWTGLILPEAVAAGVIWYENPAEKSFARAGSAMK
jgi:hypothetical protein